MKAVILILFTSIVTFIPGCKKEPSTQVPAGTPACVTAAIEANKNNLNREIGSIDEYEFQGKTVYAFEPDNRMIADAATIINDANCARICSVGGFGGPANSLCNGENFYQKAVLRRNIWKKY